MDEELAELRLQLAQKDELLAQKDAQIAALNEAAAVPSAARQQEEQATQKLMALLMKSKKLKTCTVTEAQDAIRAVGLDKDAARDFILAARKQQGGGGAGAVEAVADGDAGDEARAAAAEVKRADLAAAVAARKAAAPEEVRTVLDGGLDDVYGTAEHKRVARVVAEWLVGAHAAAHGDPATKRLARLVLGVHAFAANMGWAGVFNKPYKSGLQQRLLALGAALAEAFERAGLRAMLGDYTMAEHKFVVAARALCAKAGISFALRGDIQDVVKLPKAIAQSVSGRDEVARQRHERVFIHMLKMIAMALNDQFHAMMRETLAAHTVAGKGLMQQKDGVYYMCPEKGVARMEW